MDTPNKPKKYYLGFISEMFNVHQYHCTHLYLGVLTDAQVLNVGQIVNDYFKFYGSSVMPPVVFKTPEMFGVNFDIRVLRPDEHDAKAFAPFHILRQVLLGAGYGDKTFPDFKPHMTTHAGEINIQFTDYALISTGGLIECRWPIRSIKKAPLQ